MANVKVKIKEDNTELVKQMMERAVKVFFTEAGLHLEGEAKKAIEANPRRVDTGLLRNSITFALGGEPANTKSYHASSTSKYSQGGGKDASDQNAESIGVGFYNGTAPSSPMNTNTLYLGTNVQYAAYVHDGVSGKMEANRFLTNAVEWNRSQLEQKASQVIKREMDKPV